MIKNIENGFNRIAQVLWGLWIVGILITSKNVVNKCFFDGYIFTHFKICYGQLESWLFPSFVAHELELYSSSNISPVTPSSNPSVKPSSSQS